MNINLLLRNIGCFSLFLFTILFLFGFQSAAAQSYDRIEKERMKSILNNIKKEIKKNYYDSNFRGINIEERFKKAEDRLDQVSNVGQAFSVIAQVLIDFDDSHLYFLPPATNIDVEYGFKLKLIGDKTYIYAVKPKSDAEAKGLKIGDQVLLLEGFRPSRKDLWKMNYYFNTLSPRAKLRLNVVSPGESAAKDLEIEAKIIKKKRLINLNSSMDVNDLIRDLEDSATVKRHYFKTFGNAVIWKMMTFGFDPAQVDVIMKGEARKASHLIIDLRGNGGGYVKTLEKLAGYFFEKDIKIADRKGREEKKKENQPMLTKGQGEAAFKGKLVVLIDSQSGSASEIFARLIQLEKRGIVLGDVSAGAVMQSVYYPGKVGADKEVWYGASITNADVIMSDGKSVEHIGVTPDELIIPSAEDLAGRRDTVLARALELLGNSIPSEQAGRLFPDEEWEN